jgi:hypothetical protein
METEVTELKNARGGRWLPQIKSMLGIGGSHDSSNGAGSGNRGGPAAARPQQHHGGVENRPPLAHPNGNRGVDLAHRPPCVPLGDGKRPRESPGRAGPDDKAARGAFRLTDGAPPSTPLMMRGRAELRPVAVQMDLATGL